MHSKVPPIKTLILYGTTVQCKSIENGLECIRFSVRDPIGLKLGHQLNGKRVIERAKAATASFQFSAKTNKRCQQHSILHQRKNTLNFLPVENLQILNNSTFVLVRGKVFRLNKTSVGTPKKEN